MDTKKQRQCRRDDARLTKSRNARSKQLLAMPTESLANREWLPGDLLSDSEGLVFRYEISDVFCTSQFHCMQVSTAVLPQHQDNHSVEGLRPVYLSMLQNLVYRVLSVLSQGQMSVAREKPWSNNSPFCPSCLADF